MFLEIFFAVLAALCVYKFGVWRFFFWVVMLTIAVVTVAAIVTGTRHH